jgi:hypothetical protein
MLQSNISCTAVDSDKKAIGNVAADVDRVIVVPVIVRCGIMAAKIQFFTMMTERASSISHACHRQTRCQNPGKEVVMNCTWNGDVVLEYPRLNPNGWRFVTVSQDSFLEDGDI